MKQQLNYFDPSRRWPVQERSYFYVMKGKMKLPCTANKMLLPDSIACLYLSTSPSELQFFSVQKQTISEPGSLMISLQHSISGPLPLLYCLHLIKGCSCVKFNLWILVSNRSNARSKCVHRRL